MYTVSAGLHTPRFLYQVTCLRLKPVGFVHHCFNRWQLLEGILFLAIFSFCQFSIFSFFVFFFFSLPLHWPNKGAESRLSHKFNRKIFKRFPLTAPMWEHVCQFFYRFLQKKKLFNSATYDCKKVPLFADKTFSDLFAKCTSKAKSRICLLLKLFSLGFNFP